MKPIGLICIKVLMGVTGGPEMPRKREKKGTATSTAERHVGALRWRELQKPKSRICKKRFSKKPFARTLLAVPLLFLIRHFTLGLVALRQGHHGGVGLRRPASGITLGPIYKAVESESGVFAMRS